jgi:very-short-patch-repair endonuclease
MGKDGYRVIRLWNTHVLTNLDGVLEAIGSALEKEPAEVSGISCLSQWLMSEAVACSD